MIKLNTLITDFQNALGAPYVSPGSCDLSRIFSLGVDCSGLFTAAFRHQKSDIYHGSNTIARQFVTEREKLKSTKQLYIGAAVFKWQNDGGEPEKYKKDGLGNFHHIGLVTSLSPLRIIHASSAAGKVTTDTPISKWAYIGRLKGVEYETEEKETQTTTTKQQTTTETKGDGQMTAEVTTNLNVRGEPSIKAERLGKFTKGTIVTINDECDGWYYCKAGNLDGWCSGDYLRIIEGEIEPEKDDEGVVNIEEEVAEIAEGLCAHTDQIAAIYSALKDNGIIFTMPHYRE